MKQDRKFDIFRFYVSAMVCHGKVNKGKILSCAAQCKNITDGELLVLTDFAAMMGS